ncbi:MAG TPA: crotonobetaine/carnitine-CoA ligase [Providencia sp.]|uniref:crotonobetaine/carnitine-CoA ligase n=1 Tax=Providencia sp. TaxID=589 RepID=UPI000E9E8746|nr:crotonobetaine/carnitine-CoA ligase [Providencia sp.]MBP6080931.1 crotonobetaine/carnitine-CoA ligase [Providencia sp.]HBO24213.1 crotonobetaine/carnitine-CoA ligase [Providencia sp.]
MDVIGKQNLRQMWDDLAQTYKNKTALIFESCEGNVRELSYSQMNQHINRTANLFLAHGIQKGDKVALHLDNCPEFFFCWFGLAKIGAIMVPVNARFRYEESAWIMENCQARMVVTRPHFADIYQRILDDNSTILEHVFLISDTPLEPQDGISDFMHELAKHSPELTQLIEIDVGDTAEILFTSGTTSKPKGVVITHYNLRFAGYYSSWQCALRSDDVYLTVMPAFHIDCQCTASMAAFSVGATFVLLEKYSARRFWQQIVKYRATVTECIPMMMRTLLSQPIADNESNHQLREVLFYLNLSDEEKDQFIERFGVRLLTSYGMTETIVGLIGDRPGDKRRWPSIGRVGFCYQAQIRDKQNQPVATGVIGELCVKGERGKTLFKAYYNNPEATEKAYDSDDWLHTGDFAYQDDDGFFYFVDRSCNMIKRGGENVSCSEIENIIASHPAIVDVAVIGVADDIRDEAIKAFIVLEEGAILTEEEFFAFCEKQMAKFKVPSWVEVRQDLPRNCSGKVLKRHLK